MSQTGRNIVLDFGIGNTKYLGKGIAAPTLIAFMNFYKNEIDGTADTYFIDPDKNNHRAYAVYSKAGFIKVAEYNATKGYFVGEKSDLMMKRL